MNDFVKAVLEFESRLAELGYREPVRIHLAPVDYAHFVSDFYAQRRLLPDSDYAWSPKPHAYHIYTPNGYTVIDIQPPSPKDVLRHYAKGKCRHEIPLGYCNECFP